LSSIVIPSSEKLIPRSAIPQDPKFKGLRIVRFQSDPAAQAAYDARLYEFQHEPTKLTQIEGATLALKGAPARYRVVAALHPNLSMFREIVKYDPANPPPEDYDAIGMKEAHEETQSDFKNAKARNLEDFAAYNIEAISGERVAYLPAIAGWQSRHVFPDTVFVAFDERNPLCLYGVLYLPKKPVMQSDGQTQTAALFATAVSGMAIKTGALEGFGVTLEIELDVEPRDAAQSFADRNGRGSKKNKNLVSRFDTAAGISLLRDEAVKGTVFEHRLADGRAAAGTGETQTKNIVDLSTMEQMLLLALTNDKFKPEHIKAYHVPTLLPYAKEFLTMLDTQFSKDWVAEPGKNEDPFRKIYAHGWPYALKALAKAFFATRIDKLEPISDAIAASLKSKHYSPEEAKAAFDKAVEEPGGEAPAPEVTPAELAQRLAAIDWRRYRKPWVKLNGEKKDKKTGKVKRIVLKNGEEVVNTQAQNTNANIDAVLAVLLSPSWTELCSHENA
jgi:hypothetical protein